MCACRDLKNVLTSVCHLHAIVWAHPSGIKCHYGGFTSQSCSVNSCSWCEKTIWTWRAELLGFELDFCYSKNISHNWSTINCRRAEIHGHLLACLDMMFLNWSVGCKVPHFFKKNISPAEKTVNSLSMSLNKQQDQFNKRSILMHSVCILIKIRVSVGVGRVTTAWT